MTDITQADIAKLKEAAEKATPGPWVGGTTAGWNLPSQVSTVNSDGHRTGRIASTESNPNLKADAAFIALANPRTILALLSENERLREALGQIADTSLADPRNSECAANEMQATARAALEQKP